MKALTLHQPWAQLIALGVKTIETRSWATKYRGSMVIHAGKRYVKPTFKSGEALTQFVQALRDVPFPTVDGILGVADTIPLGAIVASCKLVDCVPIIEWQARSRVGTQSRCVAVTLEGQTFGWRINRDNLADQVPYGDFTPGRFAWLLEDIQPVDKRCPRCAGTGETSECLGFGWRLCAFCHGKGHTDPIPAKGKQGLWEWTP